MDVQNTKEVLKKIADKINEMSEDVHYQGDISDIGNEIGYCVGKVLNISPNDTEDFIRGIRHGISLTNGTH